jgi:FtsP/CotA-like multicopper oxidase with cupredoxin domain
MMMRPGAIHAGLADTVRDPFSTDTTGLPLATSTETVEVADGESFELRARPVRNQLGEAEVRMLAHNGSIPGPTLKVKQGSEATINFTNDTDVETTVHWHGLRLDNRYDGVPRGRHDGMEAPIAPGGSFAYKLRFPDPACTGTTRTSARTTPRNWECTATSSWSPAIPPIGRQSIAS